MPDPQSLVVGLQLNSAQFEGQSAEAAARFEAAANRMVSAVARLASETRTQSAAAGAALDRMGGDFIRTSERVTVGMSGVSGQIRLFGQATTALVGILVLKNVFESLAKGAEDWAFQLRGLHDVLGVSMQQVSALGIAARETNTPISNVETALRGLFRTLNSDPGALQRVGLSLKDVHGQLLPMPEILERVAAKLKEYKEGGDRLAVTMQIMQRAQPGIADELARVANEMEHAALMGKTFGASLDEEGVKAAERFHESVADLGLVWQGFSHTILEDVEPAIDELLERFKQLATDGTLKRWAEEAGAGAATLAQDLFRLGEILAEHGNIIRQVINAYIAYRAALMGLSVASAVVPAITALGYALLAVAQYGVGALTATEALTGAMTALGGAEAIATGGLSLLLPLLAGLAAWWGLNKIEAAATTSALVDTGEAATRTGDHLAAAYERALESARKAKEELGAHSKEYIKAKDAEVEAHKQLDEHIKASFEAAKDAYHQEKEKFKEAKDEEKRKQAELIVELRAQDIAEADIQRITATTSKEFIEARNRMRLAQLHFLEAVQQSKALESVAQEGEGGKAAPPGKGAESEALKTAKAKLDDELALYKDNAVKKLEIVREYEEKIRALKGAKSPEFLEAQAKEKEALRDVGKEEIAIAGQDAKTAYDIKANLLTAEADKVKENVKEGITSREAANDQLKAIADEEFAAKRTMLDQELAAQMSYYTEDGKLHEGSVEQAHALMERLQNATPEQQAKIFAEVDFQGAPDKFKELARLWNETATQLEDRKAKIDVEFPKEDVIRQAQEARAAIEGVFGDFASGINTYTNAILDGANKASEAIGSLSLNLKTAQQNALYYANAEGRQSADFINAKNQEIAAQNRLNQAEAQANTTRNAMWQVEQQLYHQAVSQVESFVLEVIKMQVLRVASEVTGNAAILNADKLTGSARLAFQVGEWARETLGFGQKETAKTLILKANEAARQVSEGTASATMLTEWEKDLLGFTTKEEAKTAAKVIGDQSRVASEETAAAESEAIQTPSTLKWLGQEAAKAYAGIIAAFSDLPLGVGIALGLAAGGAVAALILGLMGKFEQGGDVPEGMLGILHPDEMVLPSSTAEQVRAFSAQPGGASALLASAQTRGLDKVAPKTKAPLKAKEMVLPKALADHVRALATGETGGAAMGLGDRLGVNGANLFSAQEGLDEVPTGGGIGALHEGEMVLPSDTAGTLRDSGLSSALGGTTGTTTGGAGAKTGGGKGGGGTGGGKVEHSGTVHHEHHQKAGASGPARIQVTGESATPGGAGAGGGKSIQNVSVVSAPATLRMNALGGHMETTTRSVQSPIAVVGASTAGGAPVPVTDSGGPKQVVVMNKVPVSFSAISTAVSIATTMGITWPVTMTVGIGAGFGTLNAFEKGGFVPATGPALVHAGEYVLPADTVMALSKHAGMSPANAVGAVTSALTGQPATVLDPSLLDLTGGTGGGAVMRFDSRLAATTSTFTTTATRHEELLTRIADQSAPDKFDIHVDYKAWDVPTAHDQIDRHAAHLARAVAKQLKHTNPGRRR